VVEAAAVAKLAFLARVRVVVLARDGLVVGVDCAERSLSEVLGQGIIRLSELIRAVGELTVFVERA